MKAQVSALLEAANQSEGRDRMRSGSTVLCYCCIAIAFAFKAEIFQKESPDVWQTLPCFPGAIPQVTNETDTGTVTVMAFTSEAVEAARRTGAAVPVSTGGADAAEVPSQVLAQAMEMAAAKVRMLQNSTGN